MQEKEKKGLVDSEHDPVIPARSLTSIISRGNGANDK